MSQRFTIDGADALEAHLAATCEGVAEGVNQLVPTSSLRGLLLGGGYGRGEGGVLKTPSGDKPYNDLEFYVFVRGNPVLAERKFRATLHHLGESLSPEAGLEVEFKVLTLEKIATSPPSMFYYDLVAGHRWLIGDDSLLGGCDHHRDPRSIPLHEATRLLFNRCSGLLFALERLQRANFGAEEADFTGRNLAKAQLAFGDAFLAAHGQYHWSCRERHQRLLDLNVSGLPPWFESLKTEHASAVQFKLHPTRSSVSSQTLAARHSALTELGKQVWLWLESKRLGCSFGGPREYALSAVPKCAETSAWRNRLINLRAFGISGLSCARYPRERLFNSLALLLWEPNLGPDLLDKVQSELRTSARDLPGLVGAYRHLWRRCN